MIESGRRRPPSSVRVRAEDVARLAEVSISTVSLVVNDKWRGRVSERTAARVHEAVRRSGYVVDEHARRLATGRAGAIALVAPAFTNPFYARVAMGVSSVLPTDIQLLVPVPASDDDPAGTIDRLLALRLDGALVMAPRFDTVQHLRPDLPAVVLDSPDPIEGYARVNLDIAGAARLLAEHLLALGHRRIAFLGGKPTTGTLALRGAVLADTVAGAGGIVLSPPGFSTRLDTADAAVAFAAAWPLLRSERVTAVVAATDLQAWGVLRAAGDLGLDVPRQLSVAGFDDLPLSAMMVPDLTTVALPAYELGRAGAEALLAVMAAHQRGEALALGPVPELAATLMVRRSTAVPDPSSV